MNEQVVGNSGPSSCPKATFHRRCATLRRLDVRSHGFCVGPQLMTLMYERNNCRLLRFRDGDENFDPSALEPGKKVLYANPLGPRPAGPFGLFV